MSGRDDEPISKQEALRRGSIPAPASVPRPSRPPPPAAGARSISTPPTSTPPVTGRKGTLDGLHPESKPPNAFTAPRPIAAQAYSYAEPTEDDFDAEKTMVVDPDDAPTADYDPRAHAPTSQAHPAVGAAASRPASHAPARATGGGPASNPPPTDLTRPVIPAAPQPPTFDAPGAASTSSMSVPRPSEMGRRKTSRRTVKIPDPTASDAPTPQEASPSRLDSAPTPEPLASADFGPEEITIVQALRIISIGSDPPPPITSAVATWPPASHRTFEEEALEAGWTPAAPSVVQRVDVVSRGTPSEAPVIVVETRDQEGLDLDALPEVAISSGDEILEEIEPDAMPFAAPSAPTESQRAKRPPPPPPKKDAKPEAPKAETPKPAATATEAPPKAKLWWEDIFSDEYIRTMDRPDERTILREVNFIEESLGMEKHAVVLDLACGMGDHAVELAARGYSVVGYDYSKGMLKIAEQKVKSRMRSATTYAPPNLVQGDMRELNYNEAFDGVYCWGTSLGYFDDEKNLAVLQKVHRALRQGGMFLLEVINRDYVAPRSPSLVWFEGTQCVCMDDMYVDFFTSRMRVKRTAMFEGGLSRELDYSIRLYTLHELGTLLHQVGFKVIEVTGHTAHPGVFFGTESPSLIILAERS
ncbi:MAG: methyltransferase domain-containing protein [Polyangiaceae bacterium]|nr:methyltransferase domain-containing protein [Polyangiaceae bacterium]